jgi:hypothetical protein
VPGGREIAVRRGEPLIDFAAALDVGRLVGRIIVKAADAEVEGHVAVGIDKQPAVALRLDPEEAGRIQPQPLLAAGEPAPPVDGEGLVGRPVGGLASNVGLQLGFIHHFAREILAGGLTEAVHQELRLRGDGLRRSAMRLLADHEAVHLRARVVRNRDLPREHLPAPFAEIGELLVGEVGETAYRKRVADRVDEGEPPGVPLEQVRLGRLRGGKLLRLALPDRPGSPVITELRADPGAEAEALDQAGVSELQIHPTPFGYFDMDSDVLGIGEVGALPCDLLLKGFSVARE